MFHINESPARFTINPATNLPMINGGRSGVDVGGSPFGFDIHWTWPPERDSSTFSASDAIFGSTG